MDLRKSVYIIISLLMILCVTGCADKDLQGTPEHEAVAATQGMTENASEPSEGLSEEAENPFISHSADLLTEEDVLMVLKEAFSKEGVRQKLEEILFRRREEISRTL